MILIDLNQVMISNMMMQIGNHQNAEVDENMLRHMVLNSLRSNKVKFEKDYGEFIICADDKNYWRREMFPYYKASRRKSREKSELDWNAIFSALNAIREELKTFFPYKVIQIEHAEADDVIGTIVHKEGKILNTGEERILILSGDKDYIQLHKYANVDQFDPVRKRWIKCNHPDIFLREHIIKGDTGDGIPNILSSDDTFVANARQKPLRAKKIDELLSNGIPTELDHNYHRNRMMIDLDRVPNTIRNETIEVLQQQCGKDRSKLFNYFIKHKLKNLTEVIAEF